MRATFFAAASVIAVFILCPSFRAVTGRFLAAGLATSCMPVYSGLSVESLCEISYSTFRHYVAKFIACTPGGDEAATRSDCYPLGGVSRGVSGACGRDGV